MKSRDQILAAAGDIEFDLVVIGGGIVGAGVAQNAALRGLSVLLVEKDDFAAGTSSRTTKLIHGGLRYLEQLKINLTRQLCSERDLLHKLAPQLVKDLSIILPLPKNNPLFAWKARFGLTLYDLLAGSIGVVHKHTTLSADELAEAVPALASANLSGGLRFYDCITDDARLVLAVIKSAGAAGASAINYLQAVGFDINKKVTAVLCHDRISGREITVRCKMCVNAGGVWTDSLLHQINPNQQAQVIPSKGTHLVVPPSAIETNSALFLPASDGRFVFVIPWERALLIGTTDAPYDGDLDNVLPKREEVDYLLNTVNNYCTTRKLTYKNITAAWSGIRPLVKDLSKHMKLIDQANEHKIMPSATSSPTSSISREHLIIQNPASIVSVIGGKLTNYRLIASEVMDCVLSGSPLASKGNRNKFVTSKVMLGGWQNKKDFLITTAAIAARARKLAVEPATLEHLIASYGKDAMMVLDIIENEPEMNTRICPDFPPILAEISHCVINEMTVSLEDLLFRRIRLGMLHQIQCRAAVPKVAAIVQKHLQWEEARTALEISTLEKTLDAHMECFMEKA